MVDTGILQLADHDDMFTKVREEADLVLAASLPAALLARIAGHRLPKHTSAIDVVHQVGRISSETDCRVFLLGGSLGSSIRTSDALRRTHPCAP